MPRPTSTRNDAILSSEYSLGQAVLHVLPDRWIEIHSGFPDGKLIRKRLPEEAHEPTHVSPDGNRIAATDATAGDLLFYDVTTMQLLLRFPAEGISFYPCRLFSREGSLFTGYDLATKSRVVWRVADGREMARLTLDDTLFHQWWLRDSRTIVVAHPAGAYVWDTERNVNRGFLSEPGVAPVGCGFSEDGKWIIAAIPWFRFNQATFVALQAASPDTPAP